jgi:hypothetical protein
MSDRPTTSGAVAFGLAILLICSFFFRMYFIGSSGQGDLLWNQHEAYLFIHGGYAGYRVSYLGYLGQLLEVKLLPIGIGSDESASYTLVFEITPSEVRRYEMKGNFVYYTPLDGAIYAGRQDNTSLWKWAGTGFEQASEQEQKRYDGINRLSREDFDKVVGWSAKYGAVPATHRQVNFELEGKPWALFTEMLSLTKGEVFIDLIRPGGNSERIYYATLSPSRVSRMQYEHIFGP